LQKITADKAGMSSICQHIGACQRDVVFRGKTNSLPRRDGTPFNLRRRI
jgi:hypothetical protein